MSSSLWRWRHHDVMIWYLWSLRTSLWYDLESTESRDCFTHKLQSRCHSWTWNLHSWAGLCWVHSSSKMALRDHTRGSVSAASLTWNRDTKALLCSCFSFSTLSLTYKTRMSKPAHINLQLYPTGIVSESLFSSRWQSWVVPRLSVGPCSSRPCEASMLHPAGVGWLLSLTHFSLSSFPFLPLPWVLVPARSHLLNSIVLLLKDSECYSEMLGLRGMHTPKVLSALWQDELLETIQSQTALLSFMSILNKRQSSFLLNFWQRQFRCLRAKWLFEAVSWQKEKWSRENLANAVEKLNLTLMVFLMEVWVSIRHHRQGWEKFIFTRGGC